MRGGNRCAQKHRKQVDGKLLLDPGEHELVVQADGYRDLSRRVRAEGGKHGDLKLRLEPVASTAGDAAAAVRVEPTEGGSGRLWTWVAAGGAVVFAGTAALFWALGSGEYSDLEDGCRDDGCPTDRRVDEVVAETSLETYETLTTVSLVLSGAALVSSGVLFLVEAPSSDDEPEGVAIGIGPGSVRVRGRF